jgi:hypothetical protein
MGDGDRHWQNIIDASFIHKAKIRKLAKEMAERYDEMLLTHKIHSDVMKGRMAELFMWLNKVDELLNREGSDEYNTL